MRVCHATDGISMLLAVSPSLLLVGQVTSHGWLPPEKRARDKVALETVAAPEDIVAMLADVPPIVSVWEKVVKLCLHMLNEEGEPGLTT